MGHYAVISWSLNCEVWLGGAMKNAVLVMWYEPLK